MVQWTVRPWVMVWVLTWGEQLVTRSVFPLVLRLALLWATPRVLLSEKLTGLLWVQPRVHCLGQWWAWLLEPRWVTQ